MQQVVQVWCVHAAHVCEVDCTHPAPVVCAPREEDRQVLEVSYEERQWMDALSQVAQQLGRTTKEVCLHLLVCVCVHGDTPSLESFLQEDTMQGFLGYIKVG